MVLCDYRTCSEVPFEYVKFFLEQVNGAKGKRKGDHLRAFREKYVNRASDDIFEIYRLLLPQLDKMRGNFLLKESKLAAVLIKACGLDPKSSVDAQNVQNWRKHGAAQAGNFPAILEEYLFRKYCGKQDGTPGVTQLTVGQLNYKLNVLANAEAASDKVECLRWLVVQTSCKQMRWIAQIILKDLKVGLSETRLFRDFHADAEHLYNVTMDLERVCHGLRDPTKRYPRKDVEPGQAARPQLAAHAMAIDSALKKLKGSPFVVEVKFDGERVQLHRDGSQFWYFSRRGKDHGSGSLFNLFDGVAASAINPSRCILDGEMVIWNRARKCFEPFGTLRTAFLCARKCMSGTDLLETDQPEETSTGKPRGSIPRICDIVLVYIAFDILYMDDQSVINRTLKTIQSNTGKFSDWRAMIQERHTLLAAAIKDPYCLGDGFVGKSGLQGMLTPLLPGVPCLSGSGFSKIGKNLHDIQEVYDIAIGRQEEGIVLKALDSQWRLNDRSGSWLKLKPDYLSDHEVDAVIMGCCFGTGRNGGKISEFLLGLIDVPRMATNQYQLWLVSFCRVGTGLSDVEKATIREKLNHNLVEMGQPPPKCYRLSGNSKELPDVWVKNPGESIVLQVKADIRTIYSKVFASKYSLRFPRVDRIRWDKAPSEALTEIDLLSLVESNKGSLPLRTQGQTTKKKTKVKVLSPIKSLKPTLVPFHAPCKISGCDVEDDLLKGAAVCCLSYGKHSKEEVERCVRKLGGNVYLGITPTVKYVLAGNDFDSHKVKGAIRQGKRDILSVEWIIRSSETKTILPPRPQDYVFRAPREGSSIDHLLDYPPSMQFEAQDIRAILRLTPTVQETSGVDPIGDTVAELRAMLTSTAPESRFSFLDGCQMVFVWLDTSPEKVCEPNSKSQEKLCRKELLSDAVCLIEMVMDSSVKTHETLWRQLQLDVHICGGRTSNRFQKGVTHIITSSDNNNPCALLQYLFHAGTTSEEMNWLREGLQTGCIWIGSRRWLQSCVQAGKLEMLPKEDTSLWPWDEYCSLPRAEKKRQRVGSVSHQEKKGKKMKCVLRKPNPKIAQGGRKQSLSSTEESILDSGADSDSEPHQDKGRHASRSSNQGYPAVVSVDGQETPTTEDWDWLDGDEVKQDPETPKGAGSCSFVSTLSGIKMEGKDHTLSSVLGEVLDNDAEDTPHRKVIKENPQQNNLKPKPQQPDEFSSVDDPVLQPPGREPIKKKLGLKDRVRAALGGG